MVSGNLKGEETCGWFGAVSVGCVLSVACFVLRVQGLLVFGKYSCCRMDLLVTSLFIFIYSVLYSIRSHHFYFSVEIIIYS